MAKRFLWGGIVVLSGLIAPGVSDGQTLRTLHYFNLYDGAWPSSSLTLSGSTLYGMTSYGGGNGVPDYDGTVFSLPVTGGPLTTLLAFSGSNGKWPGDDLILDGSTLYGMTMYGGAYSNPFSGPDGYGTVFSLPVTGGNLTTLLSFNGTNGEFPIGGLTLSGSTLYGITTNGGAYGYGTVFSLPVSGGNPTVLLSFDGINGFYPQGSLMLSGSTLYGTTMFGGAYRHGNVFSINTDGSNYKDLVDFNNVNGQEPYGSLTLSGSTLYGTAYVGGVYNYGMVFSCPTSGGSPTTLLSFKSMGSVIVSGSTCYGTTFQGGAYNDGSIFSINTDGSGYRDFFDFSDFNGADPVGSLILSGSTLYGVAANAGGNGSVFALDLPPVPEPSTIVLLAAGAVGLAGYGWRQRRKRQVVVSAAP